MPEVNEIEFHSKEVSDFQLSRLVRASLRKYTVPITAFISDSVIMEDQCLGISFDHSEKESPYKTDGSILLTAKIESGWKEGRFWVLNTEDGHYVIASFKRDFGRGTFRKLLQSADRSRIDGVRHSLSCDSRHPPVHQS